MTSLADIAKEIEMGALEPVTLPSGRHQTPSARSMQALTNLIENGGSKRQALLDAGFSQAIADNPSRAFLSPTMIEALKRLDLTEHSALAVIQKSLGSDKETYRLQAADMLLNVLGGYAPKRTESKNQHIVGVYSMKDLRKKMRKADVKIIKVEDEE